MAIYIALPVHSLDSINSSLGFHAAFAVDLQQLKARRAYTVNASTKNRLVFLSAGVAALALSGCANKALAPEEHKLYDGKWLAIIAETTPHQRLGAWRMDCDNMRGELVFDVVDGVVNVKLLGEAVQRSLKSGGVFEIKELSQYRALESASSNISIFDGEVSNILRGKLSGKQPKGHLDNWVQEAGAGCTTSVKFERLLDNNTQAASSLTAQFESFYMRVGAYSGLLD